MLVGLVEFHLVAMRSSRGLETAGQERTGLKTCVILSRGSPRILIQWALAKGKSKKQLCGDQPSSSIRSAADGVIALQIAQCTRSISPTRLARSLTPHGHLCFSDDLASFSPPFDHALPRLPGPTPFPLVDNVIEAPPCLHLASCTLPMECEARPVAIRSRSPPAPAGQARHRRPCPGTPPRSPSRQAYQ
ncbi:hypothetical protein BJY00DRAFT_60079 [Aspergillus carlsbadensis]|nr:hypothetical protein BJY00DRAFT_60079 [Aspergillus carlsbadensis]